MKRPALTIGLSALGAIALGLLWTRDETALSRPLPPLVDPLSVPPAGSGIKLTAHLSDQFFRGVIAMEADFQSKGAKIAAEDFLGVLNAESGISPRAKNKNSYCAGLNQICPALAKDPLSGLKAVGFAGSLEDYLSLSAEAQLPYARQFFNNAIRGRHSMLTDMGKLYLLNFNPANLGKPDNTVLYTTASGNPYWFNQASLDPEKKGYIEIADMDKYVKRSLASNGPLAPKSTPAFAYWAELRMRLGKIRQAPANV
jgi:hypothetical protein